MDGKTLDTFSKSWAHRCQSLIVAGNHVINSHIALPMELKPFLYAGRSSFLMESPAMARLGDTFLKQWLHRDGPNNRSLLPLEIKLKQDQQAVRGTFQLPRDKIQKLRRLTIKVDDVVSTHVSSFSLTCAYTSRLEPPLPTTYFGTCVAPMSVVVDTQVLLGKQGFVEAVRAISEAIKSLEKVSILNGAEKWVSSLMCGVDYGYTLRVGSPWFKNYGIDFRWRRPIKVDIYSSCIYRRSDKFYRQ
ncbi:Chloramphenicol acetyltransferase-like domain containing protein [Trema orientale]|uniref:Chloramphenicol acetyltransferase-like domain containing protein n=1 Tax=Trema orientale TaxID=63057 RepID=A0A2P5FVQ9_TREOI|nr:Chloramphenicol acetyltransferase-like domain containing protein [Trema orientale]